MLKICLDMLVQFCGRRWLGYWGVSLLTLTLVGCAAIKRDRYDVPVVALPDKFKNAPEAVSSAPESKNTSAKFETLLDPVLVQWWHAFGSPELDDLITRGLANNPDVRIATFKVAQAKARASQSIAGKGPTISVPVQASIQYPYYGVAGPLTQGVSAKGPRGETNKQLFQAGLRGDWRVDLWGELDSLAESANLQLWRASFDRDNAQANAAASIALSYVEYLALNDRIRVAHETETVLSGLVASVEERLKIGDATLIDLEQERTAVYQVRATIPALQQQREDALGTIAFLMGTVSSSLTLSDSGLDSLALPSVMPGVPSALVLRRPDVRAVEARMLAADADIDVARARILPPLDLTAQAGYGSYYLADLFKPQALFWNVMASLSATIFDGGKLSSEKDYAQAVHEEMVETYVRTIYQAVREVESALNGIRQTSNRLDAQKESADAALRAWNFSAEVYSAGAIDYLALLDTERTYHTNLDEYHRLRMERYKSLVNLFHALGGGVPKVEAIPGKGNRPSSPSDDKGGVVLDSPDDTLAVEGAEWVESENYDKEDAWLVELPGLYHRKAIDSAWIDLKERFPLLLENRFMRRYQNGRMEDSADKRLSWYRLYIAKFQTAAEAEKLCAALWSNHQRCHVVLSRMGTIVEPASAPLHMDDALVSSGNKNIKPAAEAKPASPSGGEGGTTSPALVLARDNELLTDRSQDKVAVSATGETVSVSQQKTLAAESSSIENVPAAGSHKELAAAQLRNGNNSGVDWFGQQFWLIEISDILDRNAVIATWRDLQSRFPEQMKNRTILPRLQGEMVDESDRRVSLYRLFIAKFVDSKVAREFCATLRAGQQRCNVVASSSLSGNGSDKDGASLPENNTSQGREGINEKEVRP